MAGGSYSVQVTVEGDAGIGTALVPVMAVATRRLALAGPLGVALLGLGAFLFAGAVTIIGAAVRESGLEPGAEPDRRRTRRARVAMAGATLVLALALLGGRAWWNGVDAAYRTGLYQPLHATATARSTGSGSVLRLAIDDTAWTDAKRQWTPLVPDHGHLMHLFLVRESSLDGFAHLHPLPLDSTTFEAALPPLAAGPYRVYADIVHESGFAQTLVAAVDLGAPPSTWRPTDPDDAWTPGNGKGETGNVSNLADGSAMVWERGDAALVVDRDAPLRFAVRTADGKPAVLEPYMGMAGHAMIARDDGQVFVHLHPAGTISLAALETFVLRQPGDTVRGALGKRLRAMEAGMGEPGEVGSGVVSFPYAFPKPGSYRIWVQVKRAGRILTGAFSTEVDAAPPPAP